MRERGPIPTAASRCDGIVVDPGRDSPRSSLRVHRFGVLLSMLTLGFTFRAETVPAGIPSWVSAAVAPSDTLVQRIEAIASRIPGRVGVAALHLESGRQVSVNGDVPFPMASVFKLPLAVVVLQRVDRGAFALASEVTIEPDEYAPYHSPLAERAGGRPVTLTIARLLEAMLVESDNTAADVLLRLVGGPQAVTREVRDLGITDLRLDRYERELALELSGVGTYPRGEPWSRARFDQLAEAVSASERRAAAERFARDARDTSTPEAAVALLVEVQRGAGLSAASHRRLIDLLSRTATGAQRIRTGVPAGARVAHRTGTWPSGLATNDIGLITLPGGRGRLALAVFVTGSEDVAANEAVIAEITRVVVDGLAAE